MVLIWSGFVSISFGIMLYIDPIEYKRTISLVMGKLYLISFIFLITELIHYPKNYRNKLLQQEEELKQRQWSRLLDEAYFLNRIFDREIEIAKEAEEAAKLADIEDRKKNVWRQL